jgi:hypothetical protein
MGVINRKRKFQSPGNDDFIPQAVWISQSVGLSSCTTALNCEWFKRLSLRSSRQHPDGIRLIPMGRFPSSHVL